jgi:DNA-binding NtrC family response regulator
MNILVVEDDADLRVEIVEYLERRHHRVIACGTVATARRALAEMADPALLEAAVCDVSLPDGDGVDFYVESAARVPDCRWILMSGGHDLERLDRQFRGIARRPVVLEKPLPLRSLCDALEGTPKR